MTTPKSVDDWISGFLIDFEEPLGELKWNKGFRPLRRHDFVIQDISDYLHAELPKLLAEREAEVWREEREMIVSLLEDEYSGQISQVQDAIDFIKEIDK